ncbi:hypothetical protein RRG08_017154 [Elysia crispata]|uniref:Uncharacterized protein n=1 Tax=Elysia crispata TaxID=231223 RepID=A0AAE1E8H4_9GAST|nr:hypothetical protein RRG08_017154 [Elysia crispata]
MGLERNILPSDPILEIDLGRRPNYSRCHLCDTQCGREEQRIDQIDFLSFLISSSFQSNVKVNIPVFRSSSHFILPSAVQILLPTCMLGSVNASPHLRGRATYENVNSQKYSVLLREHYHVPFNTLAAAHRGFIWFVQAVPGCCIDLDEFTFATAGDISWNHRKQNRSEAYIAVSLQELKHMTPFAVEAE